MFRLGLGSIEPIWQLWKVSYQLLEKDAIVKYIITRYNEFKKSFNRAKNWSLKKRRKIIGMRSIIKKVAILERGLKED